MCQYYFSIFEIADYMDGADKTVLQSRLKRARQPVCPPRKQGNSRVASRVPVSLLFFTVLTHTNYAHGVGRGWGVGRGLGVTLGVGETVGDGVGVGCWTRRYRRSRRHRRSPLNALEMAEAHGGIS